MNTSILISSFNYVHANFKSITGLSQWIYQNLCINKYTDMILLRSVAINDLRITKSIICLNEDKSILNNLLFNLRQHRYKIKLRRICQLIELLIKAGASIETNDNFAMHFACKYGYIKLIKQLLKAGAIPTSMMLSNACYKGHIRVVKTILMSQTYEHNLDESLRWSCHGNRHNIIELLLESGANIHAYDDELLRSVSQREYSSKLVKLLIKSGANIHARNDEAIRNVGYDTGTIKLLIKAGAVIDKYNDSLLESACQLEKVELVKLLLKHGVKITDDVIEAVNEITNETGCDRILNIIKWMQRLESVSIEVEKRKKQVKLN